MGMIKDILSRFSRPQAREDTPASQQAKQQNGERPRGPRYGDGLIYTAGSQNALCVGAVFRCVRLLSESVASLPVRYMRLRGGIYVPDTACRLNYLLNVEPDKSVNAFDFWRQVVVNTLIDGNAYILPIYSTVTMDVSRLALCGRGTVSHDTTNDTYHVCDSTNGINGTYGEDEIIHIKGLTTYDYKRGVSVLEYARTTMSIASTGDRETLNRFANGGNVRGIVSNDTSVRGFGEYQDEQLEKTAENIDDRFRQGERIVSLPGQVDFKQLSLSSTDMQFLESRKFTVREICRFFGVHPSFVFDDTSNNYKSAEQANVAFLVHTLNPLLRSIETELLRKLVSPGMSAKRRIEFDRRGLYSCDLESRVRYQTQTIAAGLYTVNEWRREENREEVEGGDNVFVSANLRGINENFQTAGAPTQDGDGGEGKKDNSDEE